MRSRPSWRGILFAIGVAAVAGASSCPDAPTGPASIEGSYRLVSVDGTLPPRQFNLSLTGWPTAFITGASLEIFPGDSAYFTTFYRNLDANGAPVGDPYSETWTYWSFIQTGDSLYIDTNSGPYYFATIRGRRAFMNVRYPLPPSAGYEYLTHDFVLAR